MNGWLPYTGAFAAGVLAASVGAFMGFVVLMGLPFSSVPLFFALAVLAPMMAALVVFGAFYRVFSGFWIGPVHWLIAAGAIIVVSLFCFALVVGDILEELPATVVMMTLLFIGGRFGLQRADLA